MFIVVLRDEGNSCFAVEQRHLVLSGLCGVTRLMQSASSRHTERDCSAAMVMLVSVLGTLCYAMFSGTLLFLK